MFCPDCGTKNAEDAKFCSKCGRSLEDAAAVKTAMNPSNVGDQKDAQGRLLASDGLPVGEDVDGIPGGERMIWRGRPTKLWSPILSLTNRYRITNQRLVVEMGFIGRRTEEVDLYRVNDVGVKQNPFERILGFGDVYVAMTDVSVSTKWLHNVPDPDRVKDLLREAARQERQRRRVLLREDV